MADQRQSLDMITWDYDEETDVLYVLKNNLTRPTWNYDMTTNVTVRVDMETLSVVGLTINNLKMAFPPIHRKISDQSQAPYMVPQLLLTLEKLTEEVRETWQKYIVEKPSKARVSDLLRSELAYSH